MRRLRLALIVLAGLGWCVCARGTLAQEDWSLTRPGRPGASGGATKKKRPARSPEAQKPAPRRTLSRDEQIERHERRLHQRPRDAFAFERWTQLLVERDGSLEPTLERYGQAVQGQPEGSAKRWIWAQLLAAARRDEEADTALEGLRRAQPAAVGVAVLHAEVLQRLGRKDEARGVLREAVERSDAQGQAMHDALSALAQLDLDADDLAAARARFDALARLDGGTAFAAGAFARALSQRGMHAQAAEEYERMAEQKRGDRRASDPLWLDAARAWRKAGQPQRAIERGRKVLVSARPGTALSRETHDVLTDAHRQLDTLADWAAELSRRARRDPALYARVAAVWDELGERESAALAYREAIRRSPQDPELRLSLAGLLSRSGDLAAVITEYEALVRIAPERPEFLVRLAELLVQVGQAERARALVRRAGQQRPRDAALHRELAELYLTWGQTDDAQRELSTLTRIEPHEPAHWIALGSQRLDQGDEKGADRAWKKLLELPGDKAQAHATLAGVLADHDRLQAAIGQIQRARKMRPGALDLERQYASLLERAGRLREAEAAWQRVLRSAEADRAARQEARQHLVVLWKRAGALSDRMEGLSRRFHDDEADLEAGRTLAQALSRGDASMLPKAAEALERIVELDPSDVESLRALESVYVRQGQSEQALEVLQRLVQVDRARALSYLRRGVEVALATYLDDQALAFAQQAVDLDPARPESHRLLGDLYRGRQQLAEAIRAYQEALRLDPTQHETSVSLAEVALARGDVATAKGALYAAVSGSRDDDLVARAARQLVQLHVGDGTLAELEQQLLPLAVARSGRPAYRRVLVDAYAAWLGPAARRVRSGWARDADRAQLRAVGRRAIKPLVEALADADPSQRAAALQLLGAVGNDNAVDPLLTLAEGGTVGRERGDALIAVGLLGVPAALPRLVAVAQGTERRLRPLAAWAVAVIGGPKAAASLRALLEAEDASVRMLAALGLGHLRDGAAKASLVERIEQERHADVRAAAIWALAGLAQPAEGGGASSRDVLVAGLGGPPQVAQASLVALADDRAALAAGLFVLAPAQRKRALWLLAGVSVKRPLEALPAPSWPFSATAYLTQVAERSLPGDARVRSLRPAVDPVAQAAARALREGGAPARAAVALLEGRPGGLAMGELSQRLDQWSPRACRAALSDLDAFARKLRSPLAETAQSAPPALASRATVLLARSGGERAAVEVARGLRDDHALRLRLLDALADGGGVVPALRAQVWAIAREDASWSVRRRALDALGAPQERAEMARLETLVQRESFAGVRAAAVRLASAAPPEWSSDLLRRAAADPAGEVAQLAKSALEGSAEDASDPSRPGSECMSPN